MKNLLLVALLSAGLVGAGLAGAQTSVMNIPALPPGASTPKPAAPAAPATGTTSTTTVTPDSPAAPTVTTLPTGKTPLAGSYTVTLEGPDTVTPGEAVTWDFVVTNTGTDTIRVEHGACDVRFEVLNGAGEVVRPDPKNTLCTMQLVITEAAPGESATMQKIRWDGKDASGAAVPAGKYTLRAKFVGGDRFTPPATKEITVQ